MLLYAPQQSLMQGIELPSALLGPLNGRLAATLSPLKATCDTQLPAYGLSTLKPRLPRALAATHLAAIDGLSVQQGEAPAHQGLHAAPKVGLHHSVIQRLHLVATARHSHLQAAGGVQGASRAGA
jgi:hypothetical protein